MRWLGSADAGRFFGPVLYGTRLWLAVCLALFVAFSLELDNPFWAGTSAAIVCQPALGASLRKGWFRMLGTVIGAVAIVILTASLPQYRFGFLFALALWCGLSGFAASILRHFAGYAAALSGYTAAIIATDELGSAGGLNGQVFDLAVARASEICIGIICAGLILALTDLGTARRRLADQLAGLTVEMTRGLVASLQSGSADQDAAREVRRDLIRRVTDMDAVIDQAIGEATDLRFNPRALQMAVDGLFSALSGWRVLALHLERMPPDQAAADGSSILHCLPVDIVAQAGWRTEPREARSLCLATARHLVGLEVDTPSMRLLADRTAEAMLGISRGLAGLMFLEEPGSVEMRERVASLRVPDLLPAFLNGIRAFLTIGIAALIWITTAWPGGATAMLFAAIGVILFSPREDAAVASATNFMIGTGITAVLAAIIAFAVLPRVTTYTGFCLAIGIVLVPAAAFSVQSWRGPAFLAIAANFIPLLGPANPMSYNLATFYNTALSILAGIGLALCGMQLLPPLSPDLRARRLLTLTLRDLRRIAAGRRTLSIRDWQSRVYGRLTAVPEQAESLQRARMVAALSLGGEIIRLRRFGQRTGQYAEVETALRALAAGDAAAAAKGLRQIEHVLAMRRIRPEDRPLALRLRGTISIIAETLQQHGSYFSARGAA